jgi:hypothetical protein
MHLHRKQSHIDRVLDNDPSHVRIFLLTDTENTTKGLLLDCVVPL